MRIAVRSDGVLGVETQPDPISLVEGSLQDCALHSSNTARHIDSRL